jgi:hypothetical protein
MRSPLVQPQLCRSADEAASMCRVPMSRRSGFHPVLAILATRKLCPDGAESGTSAYERAIGKS